MVKGHAKSGAFVDVNLEPSTGNRIGNSRIKGFGVADFDRSTAFYDQAFAPLGEVEPSELERLGVR